MLRRQAADHAELLCRPTVGLLHSQALHDWMLWGLEHESQPELLHQLVQFCRLLQRLVILLDVPLPEPIERAISQYVARELRSGLQLRAGCAPRHRRSASGASSAANLTSSYPPLCFLDPRPCRC